MLPQKYNSVLSKHLTFDLEPGVMAIRSCSRGALLWLQAATNSLVSCRLVSLYLISLSQRGPLKPKVHSGEKKGQRRTTNYLLGNGSFYFEISASL